MMKDAFEKAGFSKDAQVENLKVNKQNVVKNTLEYDLPAGIISINTVSLLDTEDDNKYKRIRRIIDEPLITEDTNPWVGM